MAYLSRFVCLAVVALLAVSTVLAVDPVRISPSCPAADDLVTLASDVAVQTVTINGETFGVTEQNPQTFTVPPGTPGGALEVTFGFLDGSFALQVLPVCVLLEGEPSSPAVTATYDLATAIGPPTSEIETDPVTGSRVGRTEFEMLFDETATIEDINGLLQSFRGRIINMLAGVPVVLVRFEDPGSLEALNGLIASVESDSRVLFIRRSRWIRPRALPGNVPFNGGNIDFIDHHLSLGAHAAWNARSAIGLPSTRSAGFVVFDFFGRGAPTTPPFNVVLVDPTDVTTQSYLSGCVGDMHGTDPSLNDVCGDTSHGYHVLGIAAAAFGGANSDPGRVTGMFPFTAPARIVDLEDDISGTQGEYLTLARIRRLASQVGPVVLNTSLGSGNCRPGCVPEEAVAWATKVQNSGLENKFLHFAAAGNDGNNALAVDDGPYAAAALLRPLQWNGVTRPNLTNTVVIENREHASFGSYPPLCLNGDSNSGGDLSAIGTSVDSMTDPGTHENFWDGSSMAAPQAAGVALYMWSLDPTKSPQEIATLMRQTARAMPGDDGCSVRPTKVIDSYGGVLAMDSPAALSGSPARAPARWSILDAIDPDNDPATKEFDENDVSKFDTELNNRQGGAFDFSRWDLNGDGKTGGNSKERFDLDLDGQWTTARQEIKGTEFGGGWSTGGYLVEYDETELTDRDILCYYAHSLLYEYDPDGDMVDLRDFILGVELGELGVDPPSSPCIPDDLEIVVETDFIDPTPVNVDTPFTVRVLLAKKGNSAVSVPIENLRVELSATGDGSITGPVDGTTSNLGEFSTTIRLDPDALVMDITVIVRDDVAPNGNIVGRATAAICPPSLTPGQCTVAQFVRFIQEASVIDASFGVVIVHPNTIHCSVRAGTQWNGYEHTSQTQSLENEIQCRPTSPRVMSSTQVISSRLISLTEDEARLSFDVEMDAVCAHADFDTVFGARYGNPARSGPAYISFETDRRTAFELTTHIDAPFLPTGQYAEVRLFGTDDAEPAYGSPPEGELIASHGCFQSNCEIPQPMTTTVGTIEPGFYALGIRAANFCTDFLSRPQARASIHVEMVLSP